ncbi:DMT family transporter [Clostridium sp.]|uniref:DMT family transporter n=1 Tax=Clostridium sp. TaxID=1506 RepID=UPI0034640EA9
MRKKGIGLMVIAAIFWSFMGIVSRNLDLLNFDPFTIAFFRTSIAAIGFFFWILKTNKEALKIDLKGIIICALYGIFTFAFAFVGFNMAVSRIPISVATVLMFTNPIWVTLMNRIFFKEKVKLQQFITIMMAIIGCGLISKITSTSQGSLDIIGLLYGVSTGVLFALQIVAPRLVEGKYEKDTMLIYGFIFSTIFLAFFTDFKGAYNIIRYHENPLVPIASILEIGVLSTFIANTCYVKATEYIDTNLASILIALEPVGGSILAYIVFKESLSLSQIIGMLIIVLAVMFMQLDLKKFKRKSNITV